MKKLLERSGVKFDKNGLIDIDPKYKRIKIDVGLADNALHSNIWLNSENDPASNTIVFGFEADPRAISKLKDSRIVSRKKIDTSKINKNFFLIPCALGNPGPYDVDVVTLYYNKNVAKSSLFRPRDYDSDDEDEDTEGASEAGGGDVDVPFYSLNHFLELIPWHRFYGIDYLKISANGSDFNIIKGASKFLDKILIITFNSNNDYREAFNNYYDIIRYLQALGYVDVQKEPLKCMIKAFNVDPTFYYKPKLNIIQGCMVSYYQIGDLTADSA